MKILTDGRHISWIFVAFMILYYNVDGTISYILTALYVGYHLLGSWKIPKIRLLTPVLFMLLVGVIVGIGNIGIDYARDIYYFTQPILYMYVGYFLEEKSERYDFYASIVVVAFVLAIIYIISVIQNPAILTQSDNIREIRNEVGKETFIALVGVVLMTTQKININKKLRIIIMPALVMVFVLQFSRASIGTIAIFYLAYYLLEENKANKKVLKRIALGLVAIALILFIIPDGLLNDFGARLLRSLNEISATSVQNWKVNDAYANWRGYEIHLVIEEFKKGLFVQKIFGYGFGNRVLLGTGIHLNGLTSIPVFHNGYIQVLNKLGIVGVIALLVFYVKNLHFCLVNRKSQNEEIHILSKFVFALMCGVIFLTYFKGGIFKGTSIIEMMLFIGFLFRKVRNNTYN